jgi:hypothetical protein
MAMIAQTQIRITLQYFHDDQIVRLFALEKAGWRSDLKLLQSAKIKVDLRDIKRAAEAAKLRVMYGLKSTEYILDKLIPWMEQNNKKLMVPLSYSEGEITNYLKGGERFDITFVDYLKRNKITWFDTLQKHQEDFADFRITPEKYIDRLYIKPAAAAVFGHYNPLGNAFFAFAK